MPRMKSRPKLYPVPWPRSPSGDWGYTDRELKEEAEFAAHREGGRLLDWRLLAAAGAAELEVRYLLEDGISRSTYVAL